MSFPGNPNALTIAGHDEVPAHPRRRRQRGSRAFFLGLTMLLLAFSTASARPKVNRTRSFYVPVRFVACRHVRDVTLSVEGEDVDFTPGLRKFQFTYSLEQKTVLPKHFEVKIRGTGLCNGKNFETNLWVTLAGTFIAGDFRKADMERFRKLARIHRDVRLPMRRVLITCSPDCEKKTSEASPHQILRDE